MARKLLVTRVRGSKTKAQIKKENQAKYKKARAAYKKRSRPEIMGRFMLKKGKTTSRFDTVYTTYTRPKGKKGRTA